MTSQISYNHLEATSKSGEESPKLPRTLSQDGVADSFRSRQNSIKLRKANSLSLIRDRKICERPGITLHSVEEEGHLQIMRTQSIESQEIDQLVDVYGHKFDVLTKSVSELVNSLRNNLKQINKNTNQFTLLAENFHPQSTNHIIKEILNLSEKQSQTIAELSIMTEKVSEQLLFLEQANQVSQRSKPEMLRKSSIEIQNLVESENQPDESSISSPISKIVEYYEVLRAKKIHLNLRESELKRREEKIIQKENFLEELQRSVSEQMKLVQTNSAFEKTAIKKAMQTIFNEFMQMTKQHEVNISKTVTNKLLELDRRVSEMKNLQKKILMNTKINDNKEKILSALKLKIKQMESEVNEYKKFLDLNDLPDEIQQLRRPHKLSLQPFLFKTD